MSYIEDFIAYSKSVCEAPESFHRWCGLWTLAAACGRRISLPFHGRLLYPNQYLILVGPSAIQKSTIGEIAVRCLQAAGATNLYEDRVTRAFLAKELAVLTKEKGRGDMCLFLPELRTALSELALREGVMEMLTRMWDCPDDLGNFLKTENEELRKGKHVCCNMLGCSTRQWLVTGLSKDEIGGGFSARTMLVYGDTLHVIMDYSPQATDGSLDSRQKAVTKLKSLLAMDGEMELAPDAAKYWSGIRRELASRNNLDERLVDLVRRRHIHGLKLAMLLSLSESDNGLITQQHIDQSMKLLESNESSTLQALQGVAPSKLTVITDEIKGIIAENGGRMTRTQLTKALNNKRKGIPPDTLTKVMFSLEEAGDIDIQEEQTVKGKRKTIIYILKEDS